jgi:hypothetical protein
MTLVLTQDIMNPGRREVGSTQGKLLMQRVSVLLPVLYFKIC